MEERNTQTSCPCSAVVYVEPNYSSRNVDGDNSFTINGFWDGQQLNYPSLEDYCVVVDLVVEVPVRAREGSTIQNGETIILRGASRRGEGFNVSFLRGTDMYGGNYLSTAPYEYSTFEDINKTTNYDENGRPTESSYVTPEMFGIKSINISYDTYQTPIVDIDFVDVRGISLFQAEEMAHQGVNGNMRSIDTNDTAGSFFKCFFKQPYPKFTLYVKGFYGAPIALTLNCRDFRATFDCQSGNFNVKVSLIGYSYSFLADLTMSALMVAPYDESYGKKYWEDQSKSNVFRLDDGSKMKTLPEIVTVMKSIKSDIEQIQKEEKSKEDELVEKNRNLSTIIESTKKLCEDIEVNNEDLEQPPLYKKDYDLICVIKKGETKDKVKDFIKRIHEEVEQINGIIDSNKFSLPKVTEGYDDGWFSDIFAEIDEVKKAFKGNDAAIKKVTDYEEVKDGEDTPNKNSEYAFIIGTETIELASALQKEIEEEIAKIKEDVEIREEEIIQDALEFKPTIANLVKIIFAHVDTYVHSLSDCANKANQTKRTLSKLGLNETDLSMRGIDSVPAFPRTFKLVEKDGSTKTEDVWIGSLNVGSDIAPEIDFVNGMLKAVACVSNEFNTNEESSGDTRDVSIVDTDEMIQLAQYKYAKIMYDNWLSNIGGTTVEEVFSLGSQNSFYKNNIHFIDSCYNNIGQKANLNLELFVKCLITSLENENGSMQLTSFLSTVTSECNFALSMVQNFLDLTGSEPNSKSKMNVLFDPLPSESINWDMDTNRFPDMVFLYKFEPSSKLNFGDGDDFGGDSFDISGRSGDLPEAISTKNVDSTEYGYKIPAFGVTYGMGNQSYFTNIEVGMDNPIATEASIRAQYALAASALAKGGDNGSDAAENGNNSMFLGQDLFTVYSNYSYTCNVTMMGCAYIQPLMYFQLNNIPLFNGAYIVYKVTHNITPGNMVTTFSGNRICNVQTPFVSKLISRKNSQDGFSYYDESSVDYGAEASINNNCEYKFFNPLGYGDGVGKNLSSLLMQPFKKICKNCYNNNLGKGRGHFGGEISKYDNLKSVYDKPLLDVLTAVVYAAGAQINTSKDNRELISMLFATNYYNRYFLYGEKFDTDTMFGTGPQSEWQTTDAYECLTTQVESKEIIKNAILKVFTESPACLVGKQCTVTKPYNLGTKHGNANEYKITSTKTLTLDDVQRICAYATEGKNGWEYMMKTYKHPEEVYYICEHQWSGYNSIFSNDKKNRKAWEAVPRKTSAKQDKTPSNKAEGLYNAIVNTCQYSKEINLTDFKIEAFSGNKDGFFISCKQASGMAQIFDVVLQTYYPNYCQTVYWCVDNNTTSYPNKVYVSIHNASRKVGVAVKTNGDKYSIKKFASDGSGGHELFYTSIRKRYGVITAQNEKTFKSECSNFADVSIENINKVTDKHIESCSVGSKTNDTFGNYAPINAYTGKYPTYRNFDVKAACEKAQIGQNYYHGTITNVVGRIGYNDYHGYCAVTVRAFLDAGLRKAKGKYKKGYVGSIGSGYKAKNTLPKFGFKEISGWTGTFSRDKMNQWTNQFAQPGDVCVMTHGTLQSTDANPGHVCMYNGVHWVSDCVQIRDGALCYSAKKWLGIKVFRFSDG